MLGVELTAQGGVFRGRDLVEDVGEALRKRRYLVGLIGDEVDLLGGRRNRMRTTPQHVPADPDPHQRHGTIGVG